MTVGVVRVRYEQRHDVQREGRYEDRSPHGDQSDRQLRLLCHRRILRSFCGFLRLANRGANRLGSRRRALPRGKRHLADLGGGQHLHGTTRDRNLGDDRLGSLGNVFYRRCY